MADVTIFDAQRENAASPRVASKLSIVVPTLNERENLEPLLDLLSAVLVLASRLRHTKGAAFRL
jgi:hypothetical protein